MRRKARDPIYYSSVNVRATAVVSGSNVLSTLYAASQTGNHGSVVPPPRTTWQPLKNLLGILRTSRLTWHVLQKDNTDALTLTPGKSAHECGDIEDFALETATKKKFRRPACTMTLDEERGRKRPG